MSNAPHLGQTVIGATPGVTTSFSTLYTPADATKIYSLWFAGLNTGGSSVTVAVTRASVDYALCVVFLVGGNAVRHDGGANHLDCTQNVIAQIPGLPIDETGCPYLVLQLGDVLKAKIDSGTCSGFVVGVEL